VSEPTSSAAGGLFAWKVVGGAAGFAAGGAGLAAIIVMLMTPPRSRREWAVGLISTVLGSICGGAVVVQHFALQAWLTSGYVGLVAVMGLAFACGLPAWAVVRWGFTWIIKRQDKDLGEVIADAKQALP
jgi:hypothetical protein